MRTRSRPNQLTVDLGSYKESWLAWCVASQVSPSQAFRQIVAKLVTRSVASSPGLSSAVVKHRREKPTARLELHLTPSEHAKLKVLAGEEGFSPTKWIVALIRARLASEPRLGQTELEQLARSNQQLLALGRNLNQIAKALNTSPHDRSAFRLDAITELSGLVRAHTETVSDVIRGSVARWEIR